MLLKFRGKFLLILVLVLIWWWIRRPREQPIAEPKPIEITLPTETTVRATPAPSLIPETPEAPHPKAARRKASTSSSPDQAPDDLARLHGIGPKIASILQAAGIKTYAQLAKKTPKQLEQILTEANVRLANPETWPEQARLAAAGDWDGLKAYLSQMPK